MDPSLWGWGTLPLTHFTVRAVRVRMLTLRAADKLDTFTPRGGVRPAGWDPEAYEARMRAIFAQRLRGPSASATDRRRPRGDREFEPLYVEPWMRFEPPPPRPPPALRGARGEGPAPGPAPRASDAADALAPAAAAAPPWCAAFAQLWHPAVPRHLAYFGWQVLHGALRVGAARVPFAPHSLNDFLCEVSCRHPACFAQRGAPGVLETASHALLACPAVAPVWAWVRDTWQLIDSTSPPIAARVLMAGDPSVWSPADPAHAPLWTLFRLAALHAIWTLRCARERADGAPFDAQAAIALTYRHMRRCARTDWLRTALAERFFVQVRVSAPPREPAFTAQQFQERWCHRGVFAAVVGGRFSFRLPLPPGMDRPPLAWHEPEDGE